MGTLKGRPHTWLPGTGADAAYPGAVVTASGPTPALLTRHLVVVSELCRYLEGELMGNFVFWFVVAEDGRRRARIRCARRDRRVGRRPASDHPVLDVLLGAFILLVLVAVLVHR